LCWRRSGSSARRCSSATTSTVRVPGTAVFLNRGKQTAPLAMRANVEHNHVRHEHVLILSIQTEPVPRIAAEDRLTVDRLGHADDGIIHVSVRVGYMETPDIPAVLRTLDQAVTEGPLQLDQASYFRSKIELRGGAEPTMAAWRKRLFIATSYLAADAAEHFGLPRDRTVIMGSHIEVTPGATVPDGHHTVHGRAAFAWSTRACLARRSGSIMAGRGTCPPGRNTARVR
jgi:KUP system potassium uptake protein